MTKFKHFWDRIGTITAAPRGDSGKCDEGFEQVFLKSF